MTFPLAAKIPWPPGAVVRAKVVEKTDGDYWIVSVGGRLLGLRNESEMCMKVNQWVDLEVISQDPYRFRWVGLSPTQKKGLNLRV